MLIWLVKKQWTGGRMSFAKKYLVLLSVAMALCIGTVFGYILLSGKSIELPNFTAGDMWTFSIKRYSEDNTLVMDNTVTYEFLGVRSWRGEDYLTFRENLQENPGDYTLRYRQFTNGSYGEIGYESYSGNQKISETVYSESRDLVFPLEVGKRWSSSANMVQTIDNGVSMAQLTASREVVRTEDISTQAGTFRCFVIQGYGSSTGLMPDNTQVLITNTTTAWYSLEAKSFVKNISYNTLTMGGFSTTYRDESELIALNIH